MTQSNQRCVADVSINALVACNAHDNSITFTKFLCERPSGNGKIGLCLNVQHSNWMRSQPLAERRKPRRQRQLNQRPEIGGQRSEGSKTPKPRSLPFAEIANDPEKSKRSIAMTNQRWSRRLSAASNRARLQ